MDDCSAAEEVRLLSWNVNGLRACARKGFLDFLHHCQADFVAVQEVRAFPSQLDPPLANPPGWFGYFAPAERPGYSGVGLYSRHEADRVETSLDEDRFDVEGRFILAKFGRLSIASVYFPKGSGRNRDNSRVPYKLDFYRTVFDRIQGLRRRGPVLVAGDYNTAHEPIDLARPKGNEKASGFLPDEREEMTPVDGGGLGGCFSGPAPRRNRALHLVAPVGWRPGAERGLANRLCVGIAECG